MRIFVCGYPGPLGGADTELWHVLRLWRCFGLEVGLIPTWHANPDWKKKCRGIGIHTFGVRGPERIRTVPGIRGAVVVAFCNHEFLKYAHEFRALGCRLVWVNCMTWLFDVEPFHYAEHGPFDAYVFQSRFQQSCLLPQIGQFGVSEEQCFQIPGALDTSTFSFRPQEHRPGSQFVVGRLARPNEDKWSERTWKIYGAIPYSPLGARVMGCNAAVVRKLGAPPAWARALAPCAQGTSDFLASLHCLVTINGGAAENWPRVGLEAMATGVPIVAENAWGWKEMIRHGETGYLASSDEEFADYAGRLAKDEPHRLQMATDARRSLETELAHPENIWNAWSKLFVWLRSRR